MANPFAEIQRQVAGLFAPVNKQQTGTPEGDGVTGELEVELALNIDDKELLDLKDTWEQAYRGYYENIKPKQKANLNYWLGNQHGGTDKIVDNVIFQSIETFLPIATRQLPTPVVLTENEEEGNDLAKDMQNMLMFIADTQKLKVKNKQIMRNWALDYLGVMKIGWDFVEDQIKLKVVDSKKMILDPKAAHDVSEYEGRYIGERRSDDATTMVKRFPKFKDKITRMVRGNMATEVKFVEWWTPKFVFWTLNDMVLDKRKNPHWNYGEEEQVTNTYGIVTTEMKRGENHFKQPKMPYIFLSVFNLGDQPHDSTSLIEQSISLQDTVNKRARQIDKNADEMNNGWILNNQFTKETAANFQTSLRRGGAARAPTENINESVQRISAPALPALVPNDLQDKRNEIQNIIGVRGSTPAGIMNERTVRGKIEIKGQDTDRIAYITDFLEQFTDHVFNWCVQMIYVYYEEEHVGAIIGKENAAEFVRLKNTDLDRELLVSVKEGSMIPRDPLLRRNEAVDLWSAGAIDPISLYEALDNPNPRDMAEKLVKWLQDPGSLVGQAQPALPVQAGAIPEAAPEVTAPAIPNLVTPQV